MAKKSDQNSSMQDVRAAIKGNAFAPVYFLFGDEPFSIDEAVDTIKSAALEKGTEGFNFDVLSGGDVTANEIATVASTFPMMAERRVVIVRDFDRLADKEQLVPYLERPSPSTVLILILNAPKPDGRLKVFKLLLDKTVVFRFAQLREYEIPEWIKGRIEAQGKEIDRDALQLMQIYSDRSLRDIQNEIDKLMIYAGDRKQISVDDINAIVGVRHEYNIFELQKAAGQKNVGRALEILEWMLHAGEQPVGMVAALTRYYQKLWVIQEMRLKGKSPADMAKFLGMNPQFTRYIDEYVQAAGRFRSEQFPAIFASLQTADTQLKTSAIDPYSAMTVLIAALAK